MFRSVRLLLLVAGLAAALGATTASAEPVRSETMATAQSLDVPPCDQGREDSVTNTGDSCSSSANLNPDGTVTLAASADAGPSGTTDYPFIGATAIAHYEASFRLPRMDAARVRVKAVLRNAAGRSSSSGVRWISMWTTASHSECAFVNWRNGCYGAQGDYEVDPDAGERSLDTHWYDFYDTSGERHIPPGTLTVRVPVRVSAQVRCDFYLPAASCSANTMFGSASQLADVVLVTVEVVPVQ